jgi:quercetin dioxygenase-like cupin family protein
MPRPTWSNLESGTANPTLAVLRKVGEALQVSIEELVAPPKSSTMLYALSELPTRGNTLATVRRIIPEPLGGLQLERIELAPNSRFTGVPHKSGTREYLACEQGVFSVHVSGEQWTVKAGDVLVFRGDQRHSYVNKHTHRSVGYSLVMFG